MYRYFVDLDGVILNTVDFIADFKRAVVASGVPQEKLDAFYRENTASAGFGSSTFCLIKGLATIAGDLGITSREELACVQRGIDDFLNTTHEYLFPDALKFLKKHQQKNLTLLSHGVSEWQMIKVEKLGIKKYLTDIIITDGERKPISVSKFLKDRTVNLADSIFMDDRGKEITAMKERYPEIKAFWITRPTGKYNREVCEGYERRVTNLTEVTSLLN